MVTYLQLEAEPWWDREIVTSPMVGLGLELRAAYGVGATSFGIKGNNAHLSGGHRSQEWINNSAYCTNHSYTVQSGLTATQARLISAFDFTPGSWGSADNRAKMKVLTKRVIDAMKAGKIDELDEVFGTLDGVNVTGYNNDRNATVTADSSHLDHIHGRFDRRYCDSNEVVSRLSRIMLGNEDTVTDSPVTWNTGWIAQRGLMELDDQVVIPATTTTDPDSPGATLPNELAKILKKIDAQAASNGGQLSNVTSKLAVIDGKLDQILAKLNAAPTGGLSLTVADHAAIIADVQNALRQGTGA